MTFRAFISVDLEPQSKLIEFWDSLNGTKAPLKMVNLEIIHLTLKFMGDTEEGMVDDIEGIMKESIADMEPFEVQLKGTGAFPNLNYMKVVWIGLEGADPLIAISKDLDMGLSKLGFKKEKRGFRPHVTVARVKGPKNKNLLVAVLNKYRDKDFGVKKVDCIRLKKSVLHREGPTYSMVREVKL